MAFTLSTREIDILRSTGDHYVRTLGQGQYGVVVLAEQDSRLYAIKMSINLKTYCEEVKILCKIGDHPNIVPYVGSWSTTHNLHMIRMQFIAGRSLLDILMENPLSEVQANRYFRQLVEGVSHAHKVAGICHRDLKAENLMISADGSRLIIIDWGMGVEWSPSYTYSQTCGSPDYAAPEVFQKRPYFGPEVDIWAMGVILYAMVTANFPFPGESSFEIAYRVCKGEYQKPDVSTDMCDLISKMLTVSQSTRISIDEIAAHRWFTGKTPNMLQVSLGRSINHSNGGLRRSKFLPDVYASTKGPEEPEAAKAAPQQTVTEKKKPSTPSKEKSSKHRSSGRSRAESMVDIQRPRKGSRRSKRSPDPSYPSPTEVSIRCHTEISLQNPNQSERHQGETSRSGEVAADELDSPRDHPGKQIKHLGLLFWKKNYKSNSNGAILRKKAL